MSSSSMAKSLSLIHCLHPRGRGCSSAPSSAPSSKPDDDDDEDPAEEEEVKKDSVALRTEASLGRIPPLCLPAPPPSLLCEWLLLTDATGWGWGSLMRGPSREGRLLSSSAFLEQIIV